MTSGDNRTAPGRWPRASGEPTLAVQFKTRAEEFRVVETLAIAPSGTGEHLFLEIEKTDLATVEVANRLARLSGVPVADVGYAGMKDKRAVASQWFSVPARELPAERIGFAEGDRTLRVLNQSRNEKKLRRGQVSRNSFTILLRGVPRDGWQGALERAGTTGVPNYFGPQRFGRENMTRAREWLPVRRKKRISGFKKGLYLSVLRSYLFNEVLAARVTAGNRRDEVDGDVIVAGSPSGPLWGRGRSPARGLAREIENSAIAAHEEICAGLEHAGLTQQRRGLVLKIQGFDWERVDADAVRVSFSLPAGGYATCFLGEIFDLVAVSQRSEDG